MKLDVKVSQSLDKLIFSPRVISDGAVARKALILANPTIKFTKSAEGISVSAADIGSLNLNVPGLELKWNTLSERFLENRLRFFEVTEKVVDIVKTIKAGGEVEAKARLKQRKCFNVLDGHQWVNVSCMTIPGSSGLCVFDEQGAGKTVTLIFAFDELVHRNEIDFALIIAPKSMVSEWPVDFQKFMDDRYKVQMLIGTNSEKRMMINKGADVIITNFETVVLMEAEICALLKKFDGRCMLVVDESFFAKNLDAKRTQSIRRLREYCNKAFVLCGTPAPNSAEDLIQQFNIVDFGYTFKDFAIPKEKDLASKLIQKIIEERGPFVRHLKTDVLPGLPAKQFRTITVQMAPEQQELYKKFKEDLRSELEAIDDVTFEKNKLSYLAKRSCLLQICSNPASIQKSYTEIPGKIHKIDEILDDLIIKQGEKVILWSFFTATISALYERYKRFNPVRYDGTITETSLRREAVRRFRDDKETMLFIGNPAAAGAGLNLQSARFAIYESMSNQAAHYLQSLDRIHRRGQTKEVEYFILLCNGTLEFAEYNRLISKEQSAQTLLGDKNNNWTRSKVLSDLTKLSA